MNKRVLIAILTLVLALAVSPAVSAADAGKVQLDVNFIGVYPYGSEGLMIQDVFDFNNQDSKPYTGSVLTDPNGKKKNGFLIPLPKGYKLGHDIKGLTAGEYAQVPEGIQVYKPLQPGKSEIEIIYQITSQPPVTVAKKVGFLTKELVVDTPQKDLNINSGLLQPIEPVTDSGVTYARYYATEVKPGTELSLAVSAAPATAAPAGKDKVAAGYKATLHPDSHVALFMSEPLVYTNPHIWAAYLFIMLILGLAACILWYKLRFRASDEEEDVSTGEDDQLFLRLTAKQDALLQRIKALENSFNAGEVEEEEYKQTREKYKQLLVKVKLQLKELT